MYLIKKFALLVLLLLFSFEGNAEGRFIKVSGTANRYKFEIPDSLLGKDILFGSRIVDLSSPSAKVYAAGQMRTPPVLVRFAKKGNIIVIEKWDNFADVDNSDPIYEPLMKNSRTGSVDFFEIESRNQDNNGSVIDVTKYFSGEISLAWPLPDNVKKGKLEPKFTSLEFIKEYADHINIRTHYEFTGGKETFTITVQYFLLLLPKEPLQMRFGDDRVGYQPYNRKSYKSGNHIETNKYISRWRILPEKGSEAKYAKGEIVSPEKPIIVYVEPYFPKDWIPYIKLGIEDWNKAFEKTGFKNVVIARDFPNDPDFDPNDIKNNVIRYIPLDEANAAGQIWTDPRSGEIIQGEVLWWNNVIDLIKMWRFTQTAASDSEARKLQYSSEITGEMIRYAISHEVGHMLGLQHNMRSSYAYPTDSLRSPSFTSVYGTTASIMDYARNNHIARPGDVEKGVRMTPPHLGPFDYLSIEYGYKYFNNIKNPVDELPLLDSLMRRKVSQPEYMFAPFIAVAISPDPSAQSESLGDDVVKSSMYGISNCKTILENLKEWTVKEGGGVSDIRSRYDALSRQYFRYISLALSDIGGVYEIQARDLDVSARYLPVKKEKQIEALNFSVKSLKETQKWLDRPELTAILGSQKENILKKQSETINSLLGNFILPRLLNSISVLGSNLSVEKYLELLNGLIFEGDSEKNVYDKNLEITYIQVLKKLSQFPEKAEEPIVGTQALVAGYANAQLAKTREMLKLKSMKSLNSAHYKFLLKISE